MKSSEQKVVSGRFRRGRCFAGLVKEKIGALFDTQYLLQACRISRRPLQKFCFPAPVWLSYAEPDRIAPVPRIDLINSRHHPAGALVCGITEQALGLLVGGNQMA